MKLHTILALVLVFLSGCASEEQTESNPYGLHAELRGAPPERSWVEPRFERIATLSRGEDYTLFNPAHVWILDDRRLYVWDGGDARLKSFTLNGEYMTTYGKGPGKGPGEIQVYASVGLWRDSIYVLDTRNRRVSYFSKDGTFGRSVQYRRSIGRLTWAGDSTRYEFYIGPGMSPFLEIIGPSGQKTTIQNLLPQDVSSIVLDGELEAHHKRAVYVPLYFPLLLTFAPGDTTATAHPTPDYNDVPVPKPRTEGGGGQKVVRPPSNRVHGTSILNNGVLSVQLGERDSLAFDLYNAEEEMEYMHSARFSLPFDHYAWYAYETELLVAIQDTTVRLYEVHSPKK